MNEATTSLTRAGMGAMLADTPPSQLPPRFALPIIFMGEGGTSVRHGSIAHICSKQSEAVH